MSVYSRAFKTVLWYLLISVNARSEVQKLLTVLEGPVVTDVQHKYDDHDWNVCSSTTRISPGSRIRRKKEILYIKE